MTDTTSENLLTGPVEDEQPASSGKEPQTPVIPAVPVTCWWCQHPRPPHACPTGARRVFIPVYGWFDVDDTHRARVERYFHGPMLILALLVLPILLVEWSYGERLSAAHPVARAAICISGAIIWLAFLVEFTIKISISESRWRYATKHWLDIVIVALPLLRPLRALRVVRAAEVARVSRVFTLRGVVMKLLQTAAATVLGLEFVRRILSRFRAPPTGDQLPAYERWSQACLIAEIRRLNARIHELEKVLRDSAASGREKPGKTNE